MMYEIPMEPPYSQSALIRIISKASTVKDDKLLRYMITNNVKGLQDAPLDGLETFARQEGLI